MSQLHDEERAELVRRWDQADSSVTGQGPTSNTVRIERKLGAVFDLGLAILDRLDADRAFVEQELQNLGGQNMAVAEGLRKIQLVAKTPGTYQIGETQVELAEGQRVEIDFSQPKRPIPPERVAEIVEQGREQLPPTPTLDDAADENDGLKSIDEIFENHERERRKTPRQILEDAAALGDERAKFKLRELDECQCWNEGQYGRVHREDCPVHGPSAQPESPYFDGSLRDDADPDTGPMVGD